MCCQGEETMTRTFVAVAVAATIGWVAPASAAKMMGCTGANMAKSTTDMGSMPDSPQKAGMMKEMGMANTAMSKGDMRGACKSYMRAQKMGAMKG